MKVICLTAVYERREITDIFYKSFAIQQRAAAENGISLSLCVISSTAADSALAEKYGHKPVQADNFPLGAKHNAGLEQFIFTEFDYMMQLGSDDILCDNFFKSHLILDALKRKVPVFGLNQLLIVKAGTLQAKRVCTLRPFGAGRFVHSSILKPAAVCKTVRWRSSYSGPTYSRGKGHVENYPEALIKPSLHELIGSSKSVQLWEPSINKGLDYNSGSRLISVHGIHKARCKVLDMKDAVIDIKSPINIHAYDKFKGLELSQKDIQQLMPSFSYLTDVESINMREGVG